MGGVDACHRVGGGGGAHKIGAVEPPLVGEGAGSGGGDEEGGGLASREVVS